MSHIPVPALPSFAGVQLDSLTITETSITLRAATAATTATCPDCQAVSAWVHSTYDRHPKDLPWGGVPVQLHLRVRRFFCDTPTCPRRTFTEQVAGLTHPSAQRTVALNTALQTLGLALGGEAGASVGCKLGISGSASTILRRAHAFIPPPAQAPRVVGIDEWAIRRGQRYGSILVDLERHRPIDLLPEHAPAPITTWFQHQPSVTTIARDRASLYAEARGTGAPHAHQVADRWHLLQNLGTALHEVLARHTRTLREVAGQLTAQRMPPTEHPAPGNVLPIPAPPGHIVGPPELRRFQFAVAKRLRAAGWSHRRIAHELPLNRRTVLKYVHATELPRRVLPQAMSSVGSYMDLVRERWAAGEHDGIQMLAALHAQGYRGSLSSVYRALKAVRTGDGRRLSARAAKERVAVRSPRQALWLLLRAAHDLSDEDRAYRDALCAHDPTIATAATLSQRLRQMVRERHVDALEPWLADAEACGIKELRRFAHGLRRDAAAVQGALTSEWSNGQTEGQINRLKMIKRTMFGRASFNLLRNRVLYAA